MRGILKELVILILTIYLVSFVLKGLALQNFQSVVSLAIVLYFGNKIVHPIIQIVLLPFNLISLGIFSSLATLLCLYAATIFLKGISVVPFIFQGVSFYGFKLSPISFTAILSFIVISVTIYFVEKVLFWLFSK